MEYLSGLDILLWELIKEKRGFHDMLCDTRVVYEKKSEMYPEYQSAAGPQMSVQPREPVQTQPGQPYRAVPDGGYSFVSDAGQVKKELHKMNLKKQLGQQVKM